MQRIPASLGRPRSFTSTAARQTAVLQGERGRWWKTEGAKASVPALASPFATVIDTTNIMVSNVKTLQTNPFAAQTAAQSPNLSHTWSASQRPRSDAIRGARFEQTDLSMQVSQEKGRSKTITLLIWMAS